MKYYRRYRFDGSCEVICTRCFTTVGQTPARGGARAMGGGHVCGKAALRPRPDTVLRSFPEFRAAGLDRRVGAMEWIRRVDGRYAALAFAAIGLLLYGLPTVIELATARQVSPWVGVVAFGDLTGCACLAALLEMPVTALVLYVALTACEAWLYATGVVAAERLLWLVDGVPMLVAAGRVAQMRLAARGGVGVMAGSATAESV